MFALRGLRAVTRPAATSFLGLRAFCAGGGNVESRVVSSVQSYLGTRTKDLEEDLQSAGDDKTKIDSIKSRIAKLYRFLIFEKIQKLFSIAKT